MGINPAWIIPVGTQVVTGVPIISTNGEVLFPAGAVGIITTAPPDNDQPYKVRFLNGAEEWLSYSDLTIHSHFQNVPAETDLGMKQYVIYRCITGSMAYGLDEPESDTDYRGIYLPPAARHWSLYGIPDQIEIYATQEQYWELQKFLNLALRANPNVLECLYTPLVELATPLAQELIAMREIFLSKLIYQTYNGYVMSQFRKLEHDLEHGGIRWKHAMHLIRLLYSGITILKEGFVPVSVVDIRDRLLAIRRNELTMEAINGWRLDLHREFDAAFEKTTLPDRPDYDRANEFLMRARRSMVD